MNKNKKKGKDVAINYSRNKYHKFQGSIQERNEAYKDIKKNLSFTGLCSSIDYLDKALPKNRKELIYGIALPKSYKELGQLKESPHLGNNIYSEINYCLIGIRKYKYEINLFLKYRDIFYSNLLKGHYDMAELQLEKIEKEICFSLWSLENRFLLLEISGRAPENKEFLSKFNEYNKSNSLTKYLAHYLSLRAEHSLSINRYNKDLENSLNQLNSSSVSELCKSYYRFKLNYLNYTNINNHGAVISLDFPHSIIDRYLNISKVIASYLLNNSSNDDSSKENKFIYEYVLNRLNYLMNKIDDPFLLKVKILLGSKLLGSTKFINDEKQIKNIDNYTTGLYDIVENDTKELLLQNPAQFDLYIIYAKSLIYQKKDFHSIGEIKSIQNEIIMNVYKIISMNSNPDQSILNLLRIANNFTSLELSYGIIDFIDSHTKERKDTKVISKTSYSISNPIVYETFNRLENKELYLDILKEKYPNSITIEFFQEKIKVQGDISKFEEKIPNGKFKVELAKKYQNNLQLEKAILLWNDLIQNYSDTTPLFETAIINLFECYIDNNQINEAIELFIDSYFLNNHIIIKVNSKKLLNKIGSNKFRNVERNINLPIFYTIVDADEVETHIAFELFNLSKNAEKPSELLVLDKSFSAQKFLFFLEFCCTSKVLMHSTFINNSKERLEERLSILNYIREKDPNNKNIISEIKSIENILVIQQGLIDLDESKIYVNEQGILENELQEFEAIYQRFEIIAGITSGSKKLLFLEGGKLTTFASETDTKLEKIEYSNNPVYEIYLELFNAVKDKFLNSQFGIVAYLSTRIRHGVLVGEIRPIFETHKLITLKEGQSSLYRKNLYWDIAYSEFPQSIRDSIQNILSDFATKVDGLIFDLIKKNLQVYDSESNTEGWFNYNFDNNDLWYHSVASVNCRSYDEFVNRIFDVLWVRTDENLEYIRGQIQGEILNNFNEYFDSLELSISSILEKDYTIDIIKSIKDCSTEIQTVIQKISRWFKRSEIKAADFQISELVNIIEEYTNKSSWHKHLNLSKSIEDDYRIKGEYKTHFADLIRIFFDNIIKHSHESSQKIDCNIDINLVSDDTLNVVISNEITKKNLNELSDSKWNGKTLDTSKLLSEGKSGFHKAFKILTSDLKSNRNDCLSTIISTDETLFSVEIKINIKDIKA